MKYYQCKLRKGNHTQTSWIPEKFAKKGKYIKIKDDNGWEVMSVSSVGMDEERARDRSQDYKKTREVSDI